MENDFAVHDFVKQPGREKVRPKGDMFIRIVSVQLNCVSLEVKRRVGGNRKER
jgi:hypothetical protein